MRNRHPLTSIASRLVAIFVAIFIAVFTAMPALASQTDLRCEAAFGTPASTKLQNLVDRFHFSRYEIDGEAVVNADHSDVRSAIRLAKTLLESVGAKTRLVIFENTAALEIFPEEKSPSGWNRMAFAVAKNYGTKLIYSPLYLAQKQAKSTYDSDLNAISISFESLLEGRGEKNLLHEIGHMKSDRTKETSPGIFSGSIALLNSDVRESLAEGTEGYSNFMIHDEVPRLAQDLDFLAREIVRNDTTAKRQELLKIAVRGREILSIMKESLSFFKSVAQDVQSSRVSSGPIAFADGTLAASKAYADAGPQTQITVSLESDGVLRIRSENSELSMDHWVAVDSSWTTLIAGLQLGRKRDQLAFRKALSSLVQHWEMQLEPSLVALGSLTEAIIESNATLTSESLARLAREAKRTVAPHLRRTSK